jgi:hypothetical protein
MGVVASLGCALAGVSGCSFLYSEDALTSGKQGDAGPSEAGVSTCNSALVFCDGFERGLDAWTQDLQGGGGVAVDSVHAFRGNGALHASMPAGGTGPFGVHAALERVQSWGKPVHMRFFVYLPSPLHRGNMGLLMLREASPAQGTLYLYTVGEPNNFVVVDSQLVRDSGTSGPLRAVALDTWVCFQVSIDGTSATLRMGDEEPLATVSFEVSTEKMLLNLGAHLNGAPDDPSYDVWFDEIAVDSDPIGCAR